MRSIGTLLLGMFLLVARVNADPGDTWILGIDHLDGAGIFTINANVGYAGPVSSGDPLYSGSAATLSAGPSEGVARVYWTFAGYSIGTHHLVSNTPELYRLDFFDPADVGHDDWQPIESQFRGSAGETYPFEPLIPWAGDGGTNHQYIGTQGAGSGSWVAAGPGPHVPSSSLHGASPDGSFMWLQSGSWLYAKWDFQWATDRSWSAIRLTQLPEPASATGLLLGSVFLWGPHRRIRQT